MSDYVRGAKPPGQCDRPPVYEVVFPAGEDPLNVTITDERMLGALVHFVREPNRPKGRSVLCLEDAAEDCPHCATHPKLWLGIVGCIVHGRKIRGALRLGARSGLDLAARAAKYGGLRGRHLLVRQARGGARGGYSYEDAPPPHLAPLPQAHDVTATMCLLLGVDRLPEYRYGPADMEGVQ